MAEELTKEYIGIMKAEKCEYIVRDGYKMIDDEICDQGEFERRSSLIDPFDQTVQVLRYATMLTFADMPLMYKMASSYAKKDLIPNVVTEKNRIDKMMRQLCSIGAIGKKRYVPVGEDNTDESPLCTYFLTEHGIFLYKEKTWSEKFLEDRLIVKNEIEVMQRLAANFIMLETERMCGGRKVEFCRCEKIENPKRRQIVYGTVEDDDMLAVFEPVFFRRNKLSGEYEEFEQHVQKRPKFLKKFFEERAGDRRKILVFIVEDSSNLKDAYFMYHEVVSDCDLVFVTHEVLMKVKPGQSEKMAPFLKVAPNLQYAGKIDLKALNPPFVLKKKSTVNK
jgi:hypothetical protein